MQHNYVTLASGDRVRYSFFTRPESPAYFVRFKAKAGGYAKLSTGQTKKPDAIDVAHRLILEHYEQIAPSSETVTWVVAKASCGRRWRRTASGSAPSAATWRRSTS
jgi:hypothetical protein